jgi:hypothetical protein
MPYGAIHDIYSERDILTFYFNQYWVGPAVFLAQVASFVIAGFVISSSLRALI